MSLIEQVTFDDKGLIPAVIQEAGTGKVLMVAYMNKESLERTIETKQTHFYSRSRQSLWHKGESSGHYQHVQDIYVDCDADCLLVTVRQEGAACHTGNKSCFFRKIQDGKLVELSEEKADASVLSEVFEVICDRKENPKEGSYTNYLFDEGIDKILKKVGEECAETIIAAKNEEKDEISLETADLLYHLMVMLCQQDMTLSDVYEELKSRR